MERNSTKQEILLLKGNSFAARQYHRINDEGKPNNMSPSEQLEEACWNGLIHELIPELNQLAGDENKLYLWQVRESNAFLELDLGEDNTLMKENHFSIDPYSFMPEKIMN